MLCYTGRLGVQRPGVGVGVLGLHPLLRLPLLLLHGAVWLHGDPPKEERDLVRGGMVGAAGDAYPADVAEKVGVGLRREPSRRRRATVGLAVRWRRRPQALPGGGPGGRLRHGLRLRLLAAAIDSDLGSDLAGAFDLCAPPVTTGARVDGVDSQGRCWRVGHGGDEQTTAGLWRRRVQRQQWKQQRGRPVRGEAAAGRGGWKRLGGAPGGGGRG